MNFLHPTYLWALTGLLIPLAIHFWNKRDAQIIKVGSIKFFHGTAASQRRAIRFNELWLLLLRMAALIILILILAEPQITRKQDKTALIYLVEPSLLDQARVTKLLDSLEGKQIRLLETGFPLYEKETLLGKQEKKISYWQLAQQMQQLRTDSIVVFTKGLTANLRGMRPTINKKIKWITFEDEETPKTTVKAQKISDSIRIISVSSDYESLYLDSETLAQGEKMRINVTGDSILISENNGIRKLVLDSLKPLKVNIVYDPEFNADMKYLEASFRALSTFIERPINVKTLKDQDSITDQLADLLVWLKKDSLPDFNTKTLVFDPESFSPEGKIIDQASRADQFVLTQRLNAENIIDQQLPENLLKLFDLHPDLDKKIKPYDKRQVDEKELDTRYKAGKDKANRASVFDLIFWLWPLFLLVLIAERVLSRYRKQ